MEQQSAAQRVACPLAGRTALITGGSRGLGLAIARAYVQAGASVMLCAREHALLVAAEREVSCHLLLGRRVFGVLTDVSKEQDVRTVVGIALQQFGHIDILVSNAGVYGPLGSTMDAEWDDWVHTLEVNLLGAVLLCRAVVPLMRLHGYGKVIQIAGGGIGGPPTPRMSAYTTSKAAVVHFTATLAAELHGTGIDVNALASGVLDTRLLDDVLAPPPARVGRLFCERVVAERARGATPMANAVAFAVWLASAASDGVTGRLFSAVYERVEDVRPALAHVACAGDLYTLRRMVPDR